MNATNVIKIGLQCIYCKQNNEPIFEHVSFQSLFISSVVFFFFF